MKLLCSITYWIKNSHLIAIASKLVFILNIDYQVTRYTRYVHTYTRCIHVRMARHRDDFDPLGNDRACLHFSPLLYMYIYILHEHLFVTFIRICIMLVQPGITDRKKDTSRVLFVADGNRCPWNLRALITSLCPGGRATITGRLSGSSTNDRMKVDSVFFFFFLGKGGERDLTGFLFFFASFVEGKIFSLSFSFRFSIDRTGCSSRYSETERFASHKQFRKSFSFMRFCNN